MPADPALAALAGLTDRHALLRAATALIPADTPRLDAELLLAHALGVSRLAMLASREPLAGDRLALFSELVARRRTHEPIAHIVGEREFWSLALRVNADVLVPRPDSETLIEQAMLRCRERPPRMILDLGTGSGALLLAALSVWPSAVGVGVDRSEAAVRVARANARTLGFGERAHFLVGDWATGLDARFDLLLCNPPYIADGTALMPDVALHEPPAALFGGSDGLDPYRLLVPQLPALLVRGGLALFEFGEGQAPALLTLAGSCGLVAETAPDLAGRPRALALRVAADVPNGLGKPEGSV